MASKDPEENCNTETEEESMVLQKRRSRRVSFAETAVIHIFDRDDEYETPSDPKPSFDGDQSLGQSSNEAVGLRRGEGGGIMELFHNVEEADGGEADGDNDTEVYVREDNFVGPVSADFIKPGQLSGSAASDKNHDVTMDSIAFSMHFRSLAGSDSGGKFKTPTSVPLGFEERTPSQVTTSANLGNMMALTGAKKPVSQSSLCISKISGRGDSNDMSIVGENLQRYDCGKISPRLDALLGEGSEDLQAVSESNHVEVLNSTTYLRVENMFPTNGQYGPELLDLKDNSDIDKGSCIDVIKKSPKLVCADHVNVGKMNADIATFSADHRTHDDSYKEEDAPANKAAPNGQIGTPNYLTRLQELAHRLVFTANCLSQNYVEMEKFRAMEERVSCLEHELFETKQKYAFLRDQNFKLESELRSSISLNDIRQVMGHKYWDGIGLCRHIIKMVAPSIPISIFHPKNASAQNRSDVLYRPRDEVEFWKPFPETS